MLSIRSASVTTATQVAMFLQTSSSVTTPSGDRRLLLRIDLTTVRTEDATISSFPPQQPTSISCLAIVFNSEPMRSLDLDWSVLVCFSPILCSAVSALHGMYKHKSCACVLPTTKYKKKLKYLCIYINYFRL